jgi:hypothetical protein
MIRAVQMMLAAAFFEAASVKNKSITWIAVSNTGAITTANILSAFESNVGALIS